MAACVSELVDGSLQVSVNCGAPTGWEQVAAAAEHKALIFGEVHGTNEIPDAFARYVCASSAQGGKTLVLLEYPTTYAEAISEASDAADPHAVLVDRMQPHWSSKDGRGSAAMLGMVETLIALRQSGRDLTIRPMGKLVGWPEGASPEERAEWIALQSPTRIQQMIEDGMAEEVLAGAADFDRTIVLVGSIHARKTTFEKLPGVRHMAMLVPDAISLQPVYDGGSTWNIVDGAAGKRDAYNTNAAGEPANSVGLKSDYLPAFDGYVSVGTVTASEPALPPAEDSAP